MMGLCKAVGMGDVGVLSEAGATADDLRPQSNLGAIANVGSKYNVRCCA